MWFVESVQIVKTAEIQIVGYMSKGNMDMAKNMLSSTYMKA